MRQVVFHDGTMDAAVEQVRLDGPCSMAKHHLHGTYEVYYLLSGSLSYFIENQTYHLEQGGLVFINEGRVHRTTYDPATSHERILIELDTHFMEKMGRLFPALPFSALLSRHGLVFQLTPEEQPRMESLLSEIIEEMRKKKTGFAERINLLLMELVLVLLRKSTESGRPSPPIRSLRHQRVYEILNYMIENYPSVNSLRDLCDHFYLNKYYLCHAFKEVTGLTVKEYLNAIRIKNAKEFLIATKDPITKIAQSVGYESVTHFDRVFKEYIGVSPLQYRRLHAKP